MKVHFFLIEGKRTLHVVMEGDEVITFDHLLNRALNTMPIPAALPWLELEGKIDKFIRGEGKKLPPEGSMNQPDQLPALQDRAIEYATKAGYRTDEANFQRVFYAYCAGFTDGSSTERARADALQAELADSDALRERLAELLKQTAVALRGEPPPLTSWSWHDVPERAAAAIAAIDVMQRAAAINAARADALEAALKELADAVQRDNELREQNILHGGITRRQIRSAADRLTAALTAARSLIEPPKGST